MGNRFIGKPNRKDKAAFEGERSFSDANLFTNGRRMRHTKGLF